MLTDSGPAKADAKRETPKASVAGSACIVYLNAGEKTRLTIEQYALAADGIIEF
jgi:hypothetical protein